MISADAVLASQRYRTNVEAICSLLHSLQVVFIRGARAGHAPLRFRGVRGVTLAVSSAYSFSAPSAVRNALVERSGCEDFLDFSAFR